MALGFRFNGSCLLIGCFSRTITVHFRLMVRLVVSLGEWLGSICDPLHLGALRLLQPFITQRASKVLNESKMASSEPPKAVRATETVCFLIISP